MVEWSVGKILSQTGRANTQPAVFSQTAEEKDLRQPRFVFTHRRYPSAWRTARPVVLPKHLTGGSVRIHSNLFGYTIFGCLAKRARMRSYNPTEFLSKLSANELPDPSDLTIVGLAKSEETSRSVLYFSLSPSCEKWLTIPIEIVESIEHLRTITCRDHQHPVVRIRFKQAEEGRNDSAFFMNLLAQLQSFLLRAVRATRTTAVKAAAFAEPCYIVDTPQGLQVCCYQGDELVCTGMV